MSRAALPGLQPLTRAIHDADGAISAQLGHAGVVASKKVTGVTAVSPRKFINPSTFEYCRKISRAEIKRVIEQFEEAAQVAVDAGFDAVELHFGLLYLPSSFLSPMINRPKDRYGGSIDNRSRLVREIAQLVREVVGNELILLGGITNFDHFSTAMREGFDFVAMARALLREPDLVNRIQAARTVTSRCNHNNKCMATVFGRAHCVLVPDDHYDPIDAAAATELSAPRSQTSTVAPA